MKLELSPSFRVYRLSTSDPVSVASSLETGREVQLFRRSSEQSHYSSTLKGVNWARLGTWLGWNTSRVKYFRHVLLGGGRGVNPGLTGEIMSLCCSRNASVLNQTSLEEDAGQGEVWASLLGLHTSTDHQTVFKIVLNAEVLHITITHTHDQQIGCQLKLFPFFKRTSQRCTLVVLVHW